MSKSIWKYDIPLTAAASNKGYEIEAPVGAQFLHGAIQYTDDRISTWFEVGQDRESGRKEKRRFRVFGTGHPWSGYQLRYMCTTLHRGGSLVLHLYEEVS